jgi:hypothetical protein
VLEDLRKKAAYVILSMGDIIVDVNKNLIGILLKRIHRIDIEHDDLYFWEVLWINQPENHDSKRLEHSSTYMEEMGLKLSIVVGAYDWHSAGDKKNLPK